MSHDDSVALLERDKNDKIAVFTSNVSATTILSLEYAGIGRLMRKIREKLDSLTQIY